MQKINFIHIPKNGGMTIRKSPELRSRISISMPQNHINAEYTKNLLETMEKYNQHPGYEHARWRDLKPNLKKNKSFAIIRNPWSKVVSRFTFAMNNNLRPENYTLSEFLEERHVWGHIPYFWHRAIDGWYPQLDHVTDIDGILRCDIIRFEFYQMDVMNYFNLKYPLYVRNVSNGQKSSNKTRVINQKNYKLFFNEKTKKIVADWYEKDIDFFGFTFDGGATKNIWSQQQ